jgi:hypothetical protein
MNAVSPPNDRIYVRTEEMAIVGLTCIPQIYAAVTFFEYVRKRVGFEVLTSVAMKRITFRDVMTFNLWEVTGVLEERTASNFSVGE